MEGEWNAVMPMALLAEDAPRLCADAGQVFAYQLPCARKARTFCMAGSLS